MISSGVRSKQLPPSDAVGLDHEVGGSVLVLEVSPRADVRAAWGSLRPILDGHAHVLDHTSIGGVIMNVLQTRCGGLDVHKSSISACICCGIQDECRSTRGVLLRCPKICASLRNGYGIALFSAVHFSILRRVQRDSVFANPAVRAAPRLPFFNYIFS
jgi:hypothetical protein